VLHRLEQVSSEEHVGSLSENLLEALRTNEAVAARVEKVKIPYFDFLNSYIAKYYRNMG
jgi:hypothetical protein